MQFLGAAPAADPGLAGGVNELPEASHFDARWSVDYLSWRSLLLRRCECAGYGCERGCYRLG